MIRILLLRLIHYVITLSDFAFSILKAIPQYDVLFTKKYISTRVEADAKKLRKLPLHVGLIVTENDISYKDLANLIVWSVTMGISYVSVYDANGDVKRNSGCLQSAVEKSSKCMQGSGSNLHDIQIYSHTSKFTENSGAGRGKRAGSVHLLSSEDGCPSLVEATRSLSRQVAAQQSLPSDITPARVTAIMQDSHEFPDPDLLLLFGPTVSLMGYIPWQIRLTEILNVPSHRGLSYEGFLSSLHTYAGTQQRCGK